jgi:hypothetical protein
MLGTELSRPLDSCCLVLTIVLMASHAVLCVVFAQGHSIGGAMAVLLMLMYVHRGVLRPQQVAPVYTFGSPGIFCDGALGACSACFTDPSTGAEACSLVSAWQAVVLLTRVCVGGDR